MIHALCTLILLATLAVSDVHASPEVATHSTLPAEQHPVSFLNAASTVSASIQRQFYLEKSGLYAHSLDKRDAEFMWGNGVMFSALVAAARHEPGTYRPVLDRFFKSLDRYWDRAAPIPGYEPSPTRGNGNDKYYDDNQWMVIAFMEAYDLTHDPAYLDRADQTLSFSLSGWDDALGGGIWWHQFHKAESKNTCSNGPAAVAALRVARARDADRNIEWARKIVGWTNEHLRDADGLFFDNQRVPDGKVDRVKLTYNAALMLRANLGLHRATGEAVFLQEAERISRACDFFVNKKTGVYRDALKFSHLLVEADLEYHRATRDPAALARARHNGEAAYERWQKIPPQELIDQASIARMLWLLADQETKVGMDFWADSDAAQSEKASKQPAESDRNP